MEEVVGITLSRGKKIKMIHFASQEINRALSALMPPFNDRKDIVRLARYICDSNQIELTYEILRNARKSLPEKNRSPYREKGLVMQVSRNS